ncbi:unnamed protein product [Linum trigynum]|uniref:Uncharacterized protein n=1 Tax=Linum trigynum TaxID=586398 RepID=A0AAV2CAF0_9ROSI
MKCVDKSRGVDTVALAAASNHNNQGSQHPQTSDRDFKNGKKFCRCYKKDYHTVFECLKLKNKKVREVGGGSFAGSVETGNEPEGTHGVLAASASLKRSSDLQAKDDGLASLKLSNEHLEKLRMLLLGSPSPSPSPPTSPSTRHSANDVVTRYQPVHLPSNSCTIVLSTLLANTAEPLWVLDTRATDHSLSFEVLFEI